MCSTLVKLTKSLPFCICTLWDTCPLPSKGAQVWRKYSSFKYLNPELYHHLIQIIHCLCLLNHIGLDLQPPARCPLGKSLFNEPMESEKSSSLQSNITKGFLVLSTMTQQTLQHWQNKIKKKLVSATTWKHCKQVLEPHVSCQCSVPMTPPEKGMTPGSPVAATFTCLSNRIHSYFPFLKEQEEPAVCHQH